MFYNAITHFSIKQTLADIEKTFRKQAPHVISHYTAGVRLIGLTTRQLERQMKKMQKSAAKNDSPYAKPLQFVHLGGKGHVQRKKIQTVEKSSGSSRDLRDKEIIKVHLFIDLDCTSNFKHNYCFVSSCPESSVSVMAPNT